MRTKISIISLIIPLFCLTHLSFSQDSADQLVQAIRENRTEEVVRLVKNGVNVNELTKIGISPLIQAVLGKNIEIVKLLVVNGADVNLNTPRFGSPLGAVAAVGDKEITSYLIEKKADINSQDEEGKTPLMTAIYEGHPELAKLLIDFGADVKIKAKASLDWTALMFATMRGDVESVKNLINAKADINSETIDGETPLQRATELENKEIIIILKTAGAK